MRYKVKWRIRAKRDLKKIGDRLIAEKIETQIDKHLATNPLWNGYPLKGNWIGRWGYHIDAHRAIYEIVCEIEGDEILIDKVGERGSVYKGYHPHPITNQQTITERPQVRDFSRKVKSRT